MTEREGSADEAGSTFGRVEHILNEGTYEATELPVQYRYLDEQLKFQEIQLKRVYAQQEIELRRNYARSLLVVLAVQIIVADAVFCVFAAVGKHWNLSDGVMQVWLAAAVVEIIGVVAIVTRHLFPRRDGHEVPNAILNPTSALRDTVGA